MPTNLTDADLETAVADALHTGDQAAAEPLLAEMDRRQDALKARLASPEALAAAAAWYAANGVAVFPLRSRGKAPLLRNPHPAGSRERTECHGECGAQGHGLYDATCDSDTVAAWWTRAPRANIGIRTGAGFGFDVVDVDGPEGYTSLSRLESAGALPTRIAQAFTPGDLSVVPPRPPGAHIYIPATGDGCATGIAPGLDYRGVGGYVVAPPSFGPSGRQYSWSLPLPTGGPGGAR